MSGMVGFRWLRRKPGRPLGSKDRGGRAAPVDHRARQMAAMRAFAIALGLRIKQVREEQDIAASELAAAIGCCKEAVHAWERGGSMPSIATLVLVAAALRCSLVDVLPDEAHHQLEGIKRSA